MNNAVINFSFAGLPEGYCFTGFDRFALDLVQNMTGYLPGQYGTVIVSETEPSADDRDKPWLKLLPGGAPTGKTFIYYLGKWVYPNPIEPGADERKIWVGNESDVWSYDGGDGTDPSSNAPTATTGAMWERDTDFNFRFPLGVGTSPAPYSTTVSVGATGGAEKVALAEDEMPPHGHPARWNGGGEGDSDPTGGIMVGPSGSETRPAWSGEPDDARGKAIGGTGGDADGATTAHNNMPPYVAVFFIRRTARIYMTA